MQFQDVSAAGAALLLMFLGSFRGKAWQRYKIEACGNRTYPARVH